MSWMCFSHIRSRAIAWILSVALSVPIITFLAQPHFGWFDKTFYENIVIASAACAAIALLVGVMLARNKRQERND